MWSQHNAGVSESEYSFLTARQHMKDRSVPQTF